MARADAPPFVLHVYAPTAAGGLNRVVEGLAIAQRAAGQRVAVAVLHLAGNARYSGVERMRAAGVELHESVVPSRGYLREWRIVRDLVRRLRPDVVHTHGARADVVGGLAARSAGTPAVTSLHGRTGGGLKWRFFEWLQHVAIRRFSAVVAVSRPQVDELSRRGFPADLVHLVQNAWMPIGDPLSRADARRRLGVVGDTPVLGWVGRLSVEKGPDVFLEALARIDDLDFHAVIIGDGPMMPALEPMVHRAGLAQRVRWMGVLPDAALLFAAFDVFVLSSRTEGTPIALFEAMAAGVPIVSAAVGGVPEVVSADEAVLVQPEDPVALAQAIRGALANGEEAKRRAANATSKLSEAYDVATCVARYDAVYRSAMPGR
jgi:glycosyltransferase involved in cell wall biosynthesis